MLFIITSEMEVTWVEFKFLLLMRCSGNITRECLLTSVSFFFDRVLLIRDSNIDCLFAIWQALNNNTISNPTFVAPHDESNRTRIITRGSKKNAETPLAPFNTSEKIEDFWTSSAVKDTKTFGYIFPETKDWVYEDRADIKRQLI